MAKKNFKAIGVSILKDVLDDSAPVNQVPVNAIMHNTGGKQLQSADSAQDCSEDVRLHVYISFELEDKLLDEVYRRKRDRNFPKGQANKRAVVEDALLAFLSIKKL